MGKGRGRRPVGKTSDGCVGTSRESRAPWDGGRLGALVPGGKTERAIGFEVQGAVLVRHSGEEEEDAEEDGRQSGQAQGGRPAAAVRAGPFLVSSGIPPGQGHGYSHHRFSRD